MRLLNIFISMLLFIGAASAVAELSGTDPAVFDQPAMADEGVSRDIGSVTWGTPTGWNDASDGIPDVEGRKILSLGLVHYDRIGILSGEEFKESGETDTTDINKTLNATSLNATESVSSGTEA